MMHTRRKEVKKQKKRGISNRRIFTQEERREGKKLDTECTRNQSIIITMRFVTC